MFFVVHHIICILTPSPHTVIIPPVLTTPSLTLPEGADSSVTCGSINHRLISTVIIIWKNSSRELAPQRVFNVLTFVNITRDEAGVYYCILQASDGREVESTLEVTVECKWFFITNVCSIIIIGWAY